MQSEMRHIMCMCSTTPRHVPYHFHDNKPRNAQKKLMISVNILHYKRTRTYVLQSSKNKNGAFLGASHEKLSPYLDHVYAPFLRAKFFYGWTTTTARIYMAMYGLSVLSSDTTVLSGAEERFAEERPGWDFTEI